MFKKLLADSYSFKTSNPFFLFLFFASFWDILKMVFSLKTKRRKGFFEEQRGLQISKEDVVLTGQKDGKGPSPREDRKEISRWEG